MRSARLPVNLIGSPINCANRLIVSPITSQNTAQEDSGQWHALQERLEAAAAAREAAEGLAAQLCRCCGALEAELGAAVAERDSALAV